MLFWKLLVAIDLLIGAGYSVAIWKRRERGHGFDFVSIAVGLAGTAGLILYAFSLPAISALFWRAFLPVFIASCAWEVADVTRGKRLLIETVVGVVPALLLVGFMSVALYRLGGSQWIGFAGL